MLGVLPTCFLEFYGNVIFYHFVNTLLKPAVVSLKVLLPLSHLHTSSALCSVCVCVLFNCELKQLLAS